MSEKRENPRWVTRKNCGLAIAALVGFAACTQADQAAEVDEQLANVGGSNSETEEATGSTDDSPKCGDLAQCDEECVDVENDPEHCGACGQTCAEGELCINGSCELTCSASDLACDGECIDVSSDPLHCGACGADCPNGLLCQSGQCIPAESCLAIKNSGQYTISGEYYIDPNGGNPSDQLPVYCEMKKAGGGWTLVAYNQGVSGSYLEGAYHAVNVNSAPVTPQAGYERAIDPAELGMTYTELGFYLYDLQWVDPSRSYVGFWIGDDPLSTYDLHSSECQLLRPANDPGASDVKQPQWDGQLVYQSGGASDSYGCYGGGSIFTSNATSKCDDGGGCVTVNEEWARSGNDPLWGWNYLVWHGGLPHDMYKQSAQTSTGNYRFYIR